jgi:hypothetical protein
MAVSTLTLSSAQPTSLTLSYSLEGIANGAGYSYTLYRNTNNTFATATLVSGFGTKTNLTSTNQTGTYTDTGLPSLTSYYYWLQGRDENTGSVRSGYPNLATSAPFTTSAYPAPTWTDNVISTSFQVGTAYSDSISATNMGSGTYSVQGVTETNNSGGTGTGYYRVVPGVFLNKTTGAIAGTPTTASSYTFTLVATNPTSSITVSFSVVVTSAAVYPPVWTQSTLASFVINKAYTSTLTASNMTYSGVYSVSSGSLPSGISLASATGALTGTPTAVAAYSFSITATNTYGSTTLAFSGNVLGGVSVISGTQTRSSVKVYNGTSWGLGTVYVYNGSTWVVSK